MTEPQAKALVAKLLAAFPHPRVEPLTAKVYIEQIARLGRYEAGLDAVNTLIRDARMLPRVSEIVDEYMRVRDRYAPPALPEPAMSVEQMEENKRQARLMVARLAKQVPA